MIFRQFLTPVSWLRIRSDIVAINRRNSTYAAFILFPSPPQYSDPYSSLDTGGRSILYCFVTAFWYRVYFWNFASFTLCIFEYWNSVVAYIFNLFVFFAKLFAYHFIVPSFCYLLQLRFWFLGAFEKLRKETLSFVVSVCSSVRLSVRMKQLQSHWTDSDKTWYLPFCRKYGQQLQVALQLDKNNGYIT